eukprot:gene7066-7130_t
MVFAVIKPALVPQRLACELLQNPSGIDVANPGLSYILTANDTKQRDLRQSAYQIVVSSSAGFDGGSIMWNSGKVSDSRMAYINYHGKPLVSSRKYWWKVCVWDQYGKRSAWSETATWTMGILEQREWSAKWITAEGAEKYALPSVGYKSSGSSAQDKVEWVQVDLGMVSQFSKIKLFPMFYNDRAGYTFPIRFKLETSNDSSFAKSNLVVDFTKADVDNPGIKPLEINRECTGRYVRLTVTKLARAGQEYFFALRQIEVLSAGLNIASGRKVAVSGIDGNDGFSKDNLTDYVGDERTFPNYSSVLFRKDFVNKPGLVHAVIHISGLSQYELTLNGHKVGKYLLAPGWTNYRKTVLYDTYDVTRQLNDGNNAIGIMLGNGMYNIQPDTVRYVKFLSTFGPAKAIEELILEYADGSVKTIGTDSTWSVHPGPYTYTNLYGGEDYDANRYPEGWDRPGFVPDDPWLLAKVTTGPGGILKGLSCAAPPIKAIDTIAPVKINRINDRVWICDFGQNASMMPLVHIKGPQGSRIRMIPAELLGADGLVDRRSATQDGVRPAWWQYTLSGKGEEQWFPRFFYQGARYLQVELTPAGKGSQLPFNSSNNLFNRIYQLVRWAQRSNMMSLMTDCPQREKMGWLEENHLNGPSLRYNFDMAPLFRKTMNDMADAQLSNGLIPNIAPEYFIAGPKDMTNSFRNSPEWGSSFIIVPWQQYKFSGDTVLFHRYYRQMKRYLEFLKSESKDNIIYTGLGDWYDIGPSAPWGSQLTPVSFTATAIYYYDNWIMSRVASLLGLDDDSRAFKIASEQIKESFNNKFYHAASGKYATGSQTSSAIALALNLVNSTDRARLLDVLVNDIKARDNSFTSGEVGYRFLLKALADNRRSDVVYAMNNQSEKPGYGYQLKMGATSLTEKWDAGISPDLTGSGFRKFNVRPVFLGGLNWVSGKQVILKLVVPVNTIALLQLPAIASGSVQEGGKVASASKGVKYLNNNNGYLNYKVNSGSYQFRFYDAEKQEL